jgi:anti-sigma factor RsiW
VTDDDESELSDEVIAKVSDFLDGLLVGAERDEVAQRVASDPTWQRAHAELTETRRYLSGLKTAHAPASFAQDVTDTIHQRSAGRFFARKTLGDRVPFGALIAVALAALAVIGYLLWASSTGSLKPDRDPASPPEGSAIDHP